MGIAVDDRLECFGDVGSRVDAVELAVAMIDASKAQFSAPISWPAKSAFF